MKLKDFKIYYLIPVFIMIDSTMSYLAIRGGISNELNPVLEPVIGKWQGIYIAMCLSILFFRMIHLEYKTGMKTWHPYALILSAQVFVIISNSLVIFKW